MEALIVQAKDRAELKFISDLLKKMQIESKLLTEEQQENLGLIKLMKEADRTQKVSREKVMEKLTWKCSLYWGVNYTKPLAHSFG